MITCLIIALGNYFDWELADWVIYLTVFVDIAIFVVAVAFMITIADLKAWNDGICPVCNQGNWKFVEAVGYNHGINYIYQCDSCKHINRFDTIQE